MSDVEAAAFSKPGQKITIQYGATPATVEKVGNTPAKPKQTWARSAAYVIGFIVIVVGGTARARRGLERVSTITRANRARFARRRVGRRDDDGSCTSAGWCF